MIEVIANILTQATHEADPKVTIPEDPKLGHYTTNLAFVFAKNREITPQEAAKDIREDIITTAPKGFFDHIDIAGPGFLNMYLSKETLAKELSSILKLGPKYGSSKEGKGKTVIVDYSAPNIAKPMSVGHLRSTVIGAAVMNLLKFQGYKVIGDNHLGDWGTQFGSLLYAYKHWADQEEFKRKPIDHLVSLYIRFHKESHDNEELMVAAREETAKLQRGDKENTRLWKIFVKESLREFKKIYRRLGVDFDVELGESFYQPMLEGVVQDAISKGIARHDEGAVKIFFENEKFPPTVIEKSDGSHLYATTDLATIKYRMAKWKPVKILYAVANEQALHLAQVFEAARMLDYAPDTELTHVKFGMMLGESGKKFSTRKGEFIKLDDLLERAKEAASEINPDSAERVGIGSVKYYDLSHYRLSDITFDWDLMLNLKGNSAPYLQYTYSRLKNIRKKAKGLKPKIDIGLLGGESEIRAVDALVHFPDAARYAAEKYEPNHLADYLFRTANVLNSFYENSPIISAEKNVAEARLAVAMAGVEVIKSGLTILGIETVERM
ncbi:MAG: arginine--tRNA ligase [Candidatus Colwellbacteria bacterium]|nr:arginine--tRNA ligase [Candidatus Colwellbacteria bacterium]